MAVIFQNCLEHFTYSKIPNKPLPIILYCPGRYAMPSAKPLIHSTAWKASYTSYLLATCLASRSLAKTLPASLKPTTARVESSWPTTDGNVVA